MSIEQDVTELTDYCPTAKELVGTTARRSLRALQPVRKSDIETTTRSEGAILIKRRDQVKMVARVGSLSVTATGEAIQEGRLGETIRVRNIDSNAPRFRAESSVLAKSRLPFEPPQAFGQKVDPRKWRVN